MVALLPIVMMVDTTYTYVDSVRKPIPEFRLDFPPLWLSVYAFLGLLNAFVLWSLYFFL